MRSASTRSRTCSPTSRHRFAGSFDLPAPLAEQEVRAELTRLAEQLIPRVSFLGAGAYRHLVPSVVMEVIGRSEFATSYTLYQPEVSQGTLQSIYEFQSLICELTGMEVASASHYDGATATAEAALMACRLTRRDRIAISTAVAPQVRAVLATYCSGPGIEIVEVRPTWSRAARPHRGRGGGAGAGRHRGLPRRSSPTSSAAWSRCASWPTPPMPPARSWWPWSSRPRWPCSRRPASTAPTWWRRDSRWAFRSRTAARTSG